MMVIHLVPVISDWYFLPGVMIHCFQEKNQTENPVMMVTGVSVSFHIKESVIGKIR